MHVCIPVCICIFQYKHIYMYSQVYNIYIFIYPTTELIRAMLEFDSSLFVVSFFTVYCVYLLYVIVDYLIRDNFLCTVCHSLLFAIFYHLHFILYHLLCVIYLFE